MLETYISQKTYIAELVLDVNKTIVHGKYGLLNWKKIKKFQLKPTLVNILVADQIMSIGWTLIGLLITIF